MAISDPSSLKARLQSARAAFRGDIAKQLRALGGDVIDGRERLSVELPDAGEGARVVVEFSEGAPPRADLCEWIRLRVKAGGDSVPLLTLGWVMADNAAADFRELGDVQNRGVRALLMNFGVDLSSGKVRSRAVVAVEPCHRLPGRMPLRVAGRLRFQSRRVDFNPGLGDVRLGSRL